MTIVSREYKNWISELKQRYRETQDSLEIPNNPLIKFYWDLGADIVLKQKMLPQGHGFLRLLSGDLRSELIGATGFSEPSLRGVRNWYQFYSEHIARDSADITFPPYDKLLKMRWGHNRIISSRCQSVEEALFYVTKTLQQGWQRDVLEEQIESKLWEREGKPVIDLESAQPDFEKQDKKAPFDDEFHSLTKASGKRELWEEVDGCVTHFFLGLDRAFAYVGRQVPLKVEDRYYILDLLFYHLTLRSYVVVGLESVDGDSMVSEEFYECLDAVNKGLKHELDAPAIGIHLCKNRDKVVVEYAFKSVELSMGVSEYKITEALPEEFESLLPTVEEIKTEIKTHSKGESCH